MNMSVIEARHHPPARQIDHPGPRTRPFADIHARSHGGNVRPHDGNRLGFRLGRIDRPNPPIHKDHVGRLLRQPNRRDTKP